MAEADPAIDTVKPSDEPIGSEAAAILLMLLGEEEAAQLIGRLDPQEVQTLGGAMFSVADVRGSGQQGARPIRAPCPPAHLAGLRRGFADQAHHGKGAGP